MIRAGLKSLHLVLIGALLGVVVTLIETACTSMWYLPLTSAVAQLEATGHLRWRAHQLLIVYNLAFVAPLLIVILAASMGIRTEKLLKTGRRSVVWGKALLALLFAMLAGVTLALGVQAFAV